MEHPTLIPPPLGLYVHIPWCVRKCPYCDFNSHQQPASLPEAQYIAALLQDFRLDLPMVQGRKLDSIFIGGGTPSLFSAPGYAQLLDGLKHEIAFADDIEITLEANPGTFETRKFAGYREAGINRLSIGIQSFNDLHLQKLGRIHGSEEALKATAIAKAAGFSNCNLDLMFGLPGQSHNEAMLDLQTAIACSPTHISWYQLTIEPNTEFFRFPPAVPEDDAVAQMQESGISLLAQHGYRRYEISAYAKSHCQSRHNRNYWEFGDYIGIGAGAHGKFTRMENSSITRTRKKKMPAHYLESPDNFTAEASAVPLAELPLEFMMNALRLTDGVASSYYAARTGESLESIRPALQKLQSSGLLAECSERLQPTEKGLNYLNEMLVHFVPEPRKPI
jgi:putative oxygen-independent coproporphyrinogen III oxidase